MWVALLVWIIGSGIFLAGWFLGVVMAQWPAEPADDDRRALCDACALREIESQFTTERSLIPAIRSAR